MKAVLTELSAVKNSPGDEVDAYERLLGDAMHGEPTLFARQDAVEAAWAIVEGVLRTPATERYAKGSWGPAAADRLVADIGGWIGPSQPETAAVGS